MDLLPHQRGAAHLRGRDAVLRTGLRQDRQHPDRLGEDADDTGRQERCGQVHAQPGEALPQRLRGRGDAEDKVDERLQKALDEEPVGLAIADHVVVNDDLERTVGEMMEIIDSYRVRP